MAKRVLVVGGQRSGKSRFAERLVATSGRTPVYLAVATPGDGEMAARITEHRSYRGEHWRTVEEPLDIAGVIARESGPGTAVLVECLTLWLSNLMGAERDVEVATDALIATLEHAAGPVASSPMRSAAASSRQSAGAPLRRCTRHAQPARRRGRHPGRARRRRPAAHPQAESERRGHPVTAGRAAPALTTPAIMVPAIMIQGTGSHVGKSVLVAGLCRALVRRGLRVAPFKAQNMSNNAAVTADGGEIGRAQALQALACRLPPSVHMNPVLLKPETDIGAQVIVQGKRAGTLAAADFGKRKADLLPQVLESLARVGRDADIVVVEGAGSPAETNLRDGDIANMGFAEAANVPVVLVGDIDRGGVIASLVGTAVVLSPADRRRIKGFLVNKLRGDVALFTEGLRTIEKRTGWPSLGVVPWFEDAHRLPAEDGLDLSERRPNPHGRFTIAVPALPRIANFDDLDPLRLEPEVRVVIVEPGTPIPAADLILIPGTKSTIGDLRFLHAQGWHIDILAHHRRGGRVLGICGGYQMLGKAIADPDGVEGAAETVVGLGLLDVTTVLSGDKTTVPVSGRHVASGDSIDGYEIHLGHTAGPDCTRPVIDLGDRLDGATSPDGLVAGTYVHGLFSADSFRKAFLAEAGVASSLAYETSVDAALDGLADHLERHVAIDRLLEIAGLRPQHGDRSGRHQGEEDRVGGEIDPERPADVSRVGVAPAGGVDEGVANDNAGKAARTGQRDAKRGGHGRLRPAGIGRAMVRRLGDHHAESPGDGAAGHGRRQRHQSAGNAARRQADEIVEPGGGPAEVLVAPGEVADRRAGRVDRPVGEKPRQAEQQKPEGRGDHVLGEGLGEGFDRYAADMRLVEAAGIATDDARHRVPRRRQAFDESVGNRRHPVVERAAGEQHRGDDGRADPAEGKGAEAHLQPGADERGEHHDDGDGGEARQLSPARAQPLAVEQPVEPADELTRDRHRVGQAPPDPVGVADRRIERQRDRQQPDVVE